MISNKFCIHAALGFFKVTYHTKMWSRPKILFEKK